MEVGDTRHLHLQIRAQVTPAMKVILIRIQGNGSVTSIMKAAEPAFPSGGTKYRGVSFMYKCARWRACIVVKGKPQHLGLFRNAKEAAIAYDEASLRTNGSPAVLNFDIDGNSTEHSTPGHGGLYGEHALTTKIPAFTPAEDTGK